MASVPGAWGAVMTAASLYGIVCRVQVVTIGPDARRWTLALYSARSPQDALGWLRERAAHLAAVLDPDPTRHPEGALVPVATGPGDDPAALLRNWCRNAASYSSGLEQGLVLKIADTALCLYYVLSAAPVPARYAAQPPLLTAAVAA
ncbi:hypothetical protein ACIOEX_11005 [Streptomyces sp. NPDC087850]|uniref:hypothetical protein n=1 Tax=Streptomyces sp. NPDC087850 TaxID=3365809 RepID=UPI00381188BC